eukprot:TRINITY_DN20134_c0_g1::TRINITY_DN20134_c0_g1_i1::g.30337::m.30337 TRINITY_DN20134_c0_g1::TRINITY_DN20134_c0_g1_i1::g.30337  ORF type:complete len:269 (+),score=52.64,sp/Q9D1J3/SARNP_MOUSE/33.88/9e-18,SAP/PF02037.22/4.8e-12,SAP/PF02037.22/1e+02,SAP/PF02037.22/5.5e+03,Herpes_capsid/PF06112.6/3.2e+03,Herpes_capsid/PF06112.6/0.06,HeH/PF12949.2/0.14,HeH/PF12949.2/4.6e+03,SR-25/PF10500.4/1.2e+03,SR-25/PF10500.4/5.8,Selenoprotein_S/PF06936.6/96,Selenoprotein_S/PF06936.6/0.17 TRINITY_DN20134_c0_g1_i1:24
MDIKKLKVPELRKELEQRGLDSTGKREVLLQRLQDALATETPSDDALATDSNVEGELVEGDDTAELDATHDFDHGEDGDKPHEEEHDDALPAEDHDEAAAPAHESGHVVTMSAVQGLNDAERIKQRAAKYNVPLKKDEEEKKKERAARFGITSGAVVMDAEKLKQRAERFGIKTKTQEEEEAKKKLEERKRRFGGTSTTTSSTSSPSPAASAATSEEELAKKKARLERFGKITGTETEEEKKKKMRADRFGLPAIQKILSS